MKNALINLLKFGLSLGIVTWLVYDVQHNDPETFRRLATQPKDWRLFALALGVFFLSVASTHVRWYWLVRALGLPFRLRDAFRLGFLCYMLNFVSLGSVGGDLFKAVFLAREHPRRRTEAVATIVVDRLLGVLTVFLLASGAVLLVDWSDFNDKIRMLCWVTLGVTAALISGFLLLLVPKWDPDRLARFVAAWPRVGSVLHRVLAAVQVYRARRDVLLAAILISLFNHTCAVFGFYLLARALPGPAPSLAAHFVIIPLAMVSGAIPLPLGALGAFEWVVDALYDQLGSPGLGLLVALAYRVCTVMIAAIGGVIFLVSRREMRAVMHDAEDAEHAAEQRHADTLDSLLERS